jgi:hypothetical protein
MPSFETRLNALRWGYVAALVGVAAYLARDEASRAVALVVLGLGLWRMRPWLHARLSAWQAPRLAWRRHPCDGFEVDAPPSWKADVDADRRHVHLDGPGVVVDLRWWPEPDETPERCAELLLGKIGEKAALSQHRPALGTLAGLDATGRAAELRSFSECGAFEVLAARTPTGRLLVALTYRDFAVPAALLARCLSGVSLTAPRARA